MIPPAKQNAQGGRPQKVDLREVLNTLFYLNRSGCQWDMLPHDLLPKSTVYDYFVQWREDGAWTKLLAAMRGQVRRANGPEHTTSAAGISRPNGTTTTEGRGDRGYGGGQRTKR